MHCTPAAAQVHAPHPGPQARELEELQRAGTPRRGQHLQALVAFPPAADHIPLHPGDRTQQAPGAPRDDRSAASPRRRIGRTTGSHHRIPGSRPQRPRDLMACPGPQATAARATGCAQVCRDVPPSRAVRARGRAECPDLDCQRLDRHQVQARAGGTAFLAPGGGDYTTREQDFPARLPGRRLDAGRHVRPAGSALGRSRYG